MKKILIIILSALCFSTAFADDFDRHRFGLTFEGGWSASFSGGADNGQPWHNLYGTAGGTLFYQYRISQRFAFKPEIGLYSYFFAIPGPGNVYEPGPFATLNGRLGLSLVLYTYSTDHISFPLVLTPFISSRFYDSAGKEKYVTGSDNEKIDVLVNDYISGGVQISFGIETTHSKPVGGGFSIFLRVGDELDTGGQTTFIIPTFGGNLSLFL